MLQDIARRYPFIDRYGKPLKLDRQKAVDQFGNEHGPDHSNLTSIVIISAERGPDTARCVETIYANTPEPFEIILSDAGSSKETIDTIAALEAKYRNLHVIYNKESTGTTGQRNQGAYYAKGAYLIFMDNDVLVLSHWLKHLQRAAELHKEIAMVGAKLLQTDAETVYYCGCHTITLEKEGRVYGIGLNKEGPMANLKKADMLVTQSGEVPWYTTTALLVKRQAFFAIGGFDDISDGKGIFIANEDKDLSLSIRKGGYKIYYCADAEAIHNHDYAKVDRKDAYHSKYRLRMEQIKKDTRYFLNKWAITYMIEKLPHENNTSIWDGEQLTRVDLDLDADAIKDDIVTLKAIDS
jgi:GT2 family glycosyltransferase